MPVLFDLGELPGKLQIPEVDTYTATQARETAEAWLQDATGLTAWPDPVPLRLKHWALELAAIVYNNPTLVTSESIDDYRVQYEDRTRIKGVLERAAKAYNTSNRPLGSFPARDWSHRGTGVWTVYVD